VNNGSQTWLDPDTVNWFQFAVESTDHAAMSVIRLIVNEWKDEVEISRANSDQCEINAKVISKASSVFELCDRLRIPMERVIAIGDGMNNATMMTVWLGVVMGNTEEDVKQLTDLIAPTNEEDGVAFIIRRYFLDDLG
jgi:hydroxymethylpyrimidine pyrophosphatase-like HAD family hydrolase